MRHPTHLNVVRAACLALVAALVTGAPPAHAADASRGASPALDRYCEELLALAPDSLHATPVANLVLERDAAAFVLERGTLYLCRPVLGEVRAAVFVGRGTFTFTPPTTIERQQLRRSFDAPSLHRRFHSLVLLFADSTRGELESALKFRRTDTVDPAAPRATHEALLYLGDERTKTLDASVANTFLEDESNGLFYAHIGFDKGDPLFFMIDPFNGEPVQLQRRAEAGRYAMKPLHLREIVTQFPRGGRRADDTPDRIASFATPRYQIDATFDDQLEFSATARVEVRARAARRKWLSLLLDPRLAADSVTWQGRPAEYFRAKDDWWLWVRCDPPLPKDSSATLFVRYHGVMVDRDEDWIYGRASSFWYPRHDFEGHSTFDLTFHVPEAYQLVTSAQRVGFEAGRRSNTSHWVTPAPVQDATFDVGFFKAYTLVRDGFPLTVMAENLAARGATQVLDPARKSAKPSGPERMALDVARCVAFYEELFGTPPIRSLVAVQVPNWRLEASPGLVRVPLARPDDPRPELEHDFYRAHEIAHQWWGLGVDTRTYHDAWLSEGFANYCALWYLQEKHAEHGRDVEILRGWREQLLQNRRFLLGRGQEAGPIWLGPRTNSTRTENDYNLVVYRKGAWVLHMLRGLLQESSGDDDTRFRKLMRDFYTAHAGGRATTEDFRRAVDRAAGHDMAWFFEQWVYGTDVPTYRFAWRAEPLEGGKWRVRGRVEQQRVPATFHMPVLVRVDDAAGRWTRLVVPVSGPTCEFELPPMDTKPARVVFNDLEAVLCEVKNVKWK